MSAAHTQTTQTSITSIGQIAIAIRDLPRAIGFYRDVLGLPLLFEAGNMAFFDCAGVRLMLSKAETPEASYSTIVYYKTADIHGAARDLRDRGIAFEAEPHMVARMPDHELWMAFLRDTEGNLLALMSEVR